MVILSRKSLLLAVEALASQHDDLDDRRDCYDSNEEWEDHRSRIWEAEREIRQFCKAWSDNDPLGINLGLSYLEFEGGEG